MKVILTLLITLSSLGFAQSNTSEKSKTLVKYSNVLKDDIVKKVGKVDGNNYKFEIDKIYTTKSNPNSYGTTHNKCKYKFIKAGSRCNHILISDGNLGRCHGPLSDLIELAKLDGDYCVIKKDEFKSLITKEMIKSIKSDTSFYSRNINTRGNVKKYMDDYFKQLDRLIEASKK